MVYFAGKKFREFCVLEKIIHRKKIYMVHTLFLTDSRKFNPPKYTTYTVYCNFLQFTYFCLSSWLITELSFPSGGSVNLRTSSSPVKEQFLIIFLTQRQKSGLHGVRKCQSFSMILKCHYRLAISINSISITITIQ